MTDGGARGQLADLASRGVVWPAMPTGRHATRPAAVLVLFGVLDDRPADHVSRAVAADLDVLLVGRASSLSHHPGQVAFPGGRLDPDDAGPAEAALREAVEETGLDPDGVEILGLLGELPLSVSDHLVVPALAWWATPSPVAVVDHGESATVFRAPVADLVDPANRRTAVLPGRPYSGPALLVARVDGPHHVDHRLLWGFTALVLDRLFTELGWDEPWDTERTVNVPL